MCGGLFSALAHIVAGIGLCLTVIGIPFGYQEIKIGVATLTPFGCELVENADANSPLWLVLNVVWLICFGSVIALHHLIWATLLALTVVGIPFALQHVKLLPLALLPFGRDLVRTSGHYQDPRMKDRNGITRVRSAAGERPALAVDAYSAAISVSSNRTLCRRSTDSCCTMRPLASYHRSTFTSPVMW